jgi:anti-anti-sigma factor
MVTYTVNKENLVCSFSGSLHVENCSKIEQELYEKVKNANMPVIFDLKEVSYIASSFLRICRAVYKEIGSNFSIINVNPSIRSVFQMTAFDKFIKIDSEAK